jgi:hypothetical protein
VSSATASAIGTLIQKIHCQENPSMTAPPRTGPAATPSPETPPQTPIAAPRFPAGNASTISVSVRGMRIAAPAPCTVRQAIRAPGPSASAAPADARAKIKSPVVYVRRRPNRSPRAAPVSMRQANTRL